MSSPQEFATHGPAGMPSCPARQNFIFSFYKVTDTMQLGLSGGCVPGVSSHSSSLAQLTVLAL